MNGIPQIQIDEAKKKFDRQDCMFVDVRDPASHRAAHIPGAEFHLFDNCAHWVQWDQAAGFNRIVTDFLKPL